MLKKDFRQMCCFGAAVRLMRHIESFQTNEDDALASLVVVDTVSFCSSCTSIL